MKQLNLLIIILASLLLTSFDSPNEEGKAITSNAKQVTNELKEKIEHIVNKEDVIQLFGEEKQEVTGEMYNNIIWRYDIGKVDSYSFEPTFDQVDMDGLKEGKLQAIVFFSFYPDEKTIFSKSIYYKEETGNIYEVKFIEDTYKEQVIFQQ